MLFHEIAVMGAHTIEPELIEDERGFFARTFCEREFREHGLVDGFVQCSISFNSRRGTVRGLHYQAPPHEEARIVRCTLGSIFDVVADVREDSPSFGKWAAAELSSENRLMLYVPAGCAHGFQTLQDNTEVAYMMSEAYRPASARGVRWDDPSLAITWPSAAERIISVRDQGLPFFGDPEA